MERSELKSIRALARALAGPDATYEEIERRRRQVNYWLKLNGDGGLSPASAERVAAVLGTDPSRYASLAPNFNRRTQIDREVEKHRARIRALLEERRRLGA